MSRQTFVFVGAQARDADLMHLTEQTLGGTFVFEEGTDPYIRVGTVAVYVGEHDFRRRRHRLARRFRCPTPQHVPSHDRIP